MTAAAPILAEHHAGRGNHRLACESLLSVISAPSAKSELPLAAARAAHFREPGKTSLLVERIESAIAHGEIEEVRILLRNLRGLRGDPGVLRRLEFLLACALGEWKAAWEHYRGSRRASESLAQRKR